MVETLNVFLVAIIMLSLVIVVPSETQTVLEKDCWQQSTFVYDGTRAEATGNVPCVEWIGLRKIDPVNVAKVCVTEGSFHHPGSFCRNPDQDRKGPWCYVDIEGTKAYCGIPPCEESSTSALPRRPFVVKNLVRDKRKASIAQLETEFGISSNRTGNTLEPTFRDGEEGPEDDETPGSGFGVESTNEDDYEGANLYHDDSQSQDPRFSFAHLRGSTLTCENKNEASEMMTCEGEGTEMKIPHVITMKKVNLQAVVEKMIVDSKNENSRRLEIRKTSANNNNNDDDSSRLHTFASWIHSIFYLSGNFLKGWFAADSHPSSDESASSTRSPSSRSPSSQKLVSLASVGQALNEVRFNFETKLCRVFYRGGGRPHSRLEIPFGDAGKVKQLILELSSVKDLRLNL